MRGRDGRSEERDGERQMERDREREMGQGGYSSSFVQNTGNRKHALCQHSDPLILSGMELFIGRATNGSLFRGRRGRGGTQYT